MLKSPAFSTSFLESRMIQKLKSRKSRIKPGLFAFLLAERIIFGKKTQKRETSVCLFSLFRSDWGVKPRRAERVGHRHRSAACGGCHSMRKIAFAIFLELAMPTPSQLVGDWQGGPAAADRAGHRKRACEASSSPSLHFRHVMEELLPLFQVYLGFSHPPHIRLQPLLPSPAPQNAPGFAFFRAESGAFSSFPLFFGRKIFGLAFVHLAA